MTKIILGKKWIAVYTKPRHEKKVALELEKKGIEAYLPLLKERRRWSDRKKWVEFPLFRSYIFVRIRLKDALYVLQTFGVSKVVKAGKVISVVRDNEIQAIKLMIDGGHSPQSENYFLEGDKVEVNDGPLKGICGEVIRIDKMDRLVVRVLAIQHSISVKIDRAYLKEINQ